MNPQLTKMADDLLESVKGFVQRSVEPLRQRIAEMEDKGLRDGRDGEPGRDALQIEVLEQIDPAKRYQRSTFAHHRGGIIRSFRPTDPIVDGEIEKAGWHIVVEGLHEVDIDGADRGFRMRTVSTSGKTVERQISLPAMIYRGVLRDGHEYAPGDTATWGGSLWHCNVKTSEKPMDGGTAWTLVAKRGRDGRDGTTK